MHSRIATNASLDAQEIHQAYVESLAGQWRSAGLKPGRIVLLHSNCTRHLRLVAKAGLDPFPDIILRSFLEALGPDGTLVLPLFNFAFTSGHPFHIASTPSGSGVLTEYARNLPQAVRTGHPIYSFCALGAEAGRFAGLCNKSGYGPDSPFALIHENDGQLAVLDLPDIESMTFMHYVEECENVPYRYHKMFSGKYTGADGKEETREFSIFVRDIDKGVVTLGEDMGKLLWRDGHYKGHLPMEKSGLRTIDARLFYDQIAKVIRSGRAKGLLYDIAGNNA